MMYTYTNSFHNTTACSKYNPKELGAGWLYEEDEDRIELIRRAGKRLRRKLCGVEGCTCGDTWYGERP